MAGTSRPSAFAVLRLMTSSTLVGCRRKIGRLHAFENRSDVDAGLTKRVAKVCAIAHQPARRDVLAQRINRGHRIAGRQRDDLVLATDQKAISRDDQGSGLAFGHRSKTRFNLPLVATGKNNEFSTKGARRRLQVFQLVLRVGVGLVRQHRGDGDPGDQVIQQFQILRSEQREHRSNPGDVAGGPIDARYQARRDRIAPAQKNNRDPLGCGLCRQSRRKKVRRDNRDLSRDQFACKRWQSIVMTSILTARRSIPASLKPFLNALTLDGGSADP